MGRFMTQTGQLHCGNLGIRDHYNYSTISKRGGREMGSTCKVKVRGGGEVKREDLGMEWFGVWCTRQGFRARIQHHIQHHSERGSHHK